MSRLGRAGGDRQEDDRIRFGGGLEISGFHFGTDLDRRQGRAFNINELSISPLAASPRPSFWTLRHLIVYWRYSLYEPISHNLFKQSKNGE
mgnify:CR=1 FL=1|jgi:hypothetical protein